MIVLKSERLLSTHQTRRCGPMGTFSGTSGAGLSPAHTISPTPSAASLQLAQRPPGAPERAERAARHLERRAHQPLHALRHEVRLGWHRARAARRPAAPTSGGTGDRSNSTVAMSTPDTPSTSAWCVFEISGEAVPLQALNDVQLPQRLRAVEALGEDPAGELAQLLVASRGRQRGVAHVVVDVEAGVVHPERPAHLQWREGEPLAIPGDELQAGLELIHEVHARGRRPLEDHERAHVHVGRLLLLVQERCVDGGQPILVSLFVHEPEPTRAPGGSPQLRHEALVTVVAVALAAGVALLLLTASSVGAADSDSAAGQAPRPADRFDSAAALRLVREQVRLGPRPAGSPKSRRLARRIRAIVPGGRFQAVPGGLRNVVGRIPGRGRGYVVVGAHYDTKDIPGFLGAVDGASGTAVALQLARTIRPRTLRRTVVFAFFDGEESPRGAPDARFEQEGLRGSKVAAPRFRDARAMVLLDYVGNRRLRIPREGFSNAGLWRKLRSAARRAGAGSAFPATISGGILDDHLPFLRQGVPSIDLIDFSFPCFHRSCDDMSAVSERSLDLTGETMMGFLASL